MNSIYNEGEKVEVTRSPADAYLMLDSADRSSSTSQTGQPLSIPQTQPYNNFRLQKPQNMVQGGFTRMQLTEVNFPYAIPNINERTASFWVVTGSLVAEITLAGYEAFFDGRSLAVTLATPQVGATPASGLMNTNPIIGTAASGITWEVDYLPNSFTHVSIGGGFTMSGYTGSPMSPTPISFALYPSNPSSVGFGALPSKSMLSLMGYNPLNNWSYLTTPSRTKISTFAPMTYTSYIDIISNKLTYWANVSDASTRTNSASNIICRLYIASENSSPGAVGYYYNPDSNFDDKGIKYAVEVPAGSQPFLIHRQFVSPKQFRWDGVSAIDWIDIQLLDDVGQPLYFPVDEGIPDFQITFKCTED